MRIAVYASASPRTPAAYLEAARVLGERCAERGHVVVNGGGGRRSAPRKQDLLLTQITHFDSGGITSQRYLIEIAQALVLNVVRRLLLVDVRIPGRLGGMGALNEGCRAAGGTIVSVIHERFIVDGVEYEDADETIVATGPNLGDRKRLLAANADVIVALPGGVGTLDELFEAAALSQLDFAGAKPVAIVDVQGYYEGALKQLARAHADGLLSKSPEKIFYVATDVDDVLAFCEATLSKKKKNGSAAKTNGGSEEKAPVATAAAANGAVARDDSARRAVARRLRRFSRGDRLAAFATGLVVGALAVALATRSSRR